MAATGTAAGRKSRPYRSNPLRAWLSHHLACARDSLRRLLHSPLSSIMGWLVIGIALALPVGLLLVLDDARDLVDRLDDPVQLSLFLEMQLPPAEVRELLQTLAQRPDVAATRLVTPRQALQEFEQMLGLGDLLDHLDANPLPNLILVSPAASPADRAAADLQSALGALPGVERVVLDMAWVQRLNSILRLGERLVMVIGGLLGLGVLLVVGNSIRLIIESRRDEILIIKLVGGSDAYVRRPCLYTGLGYGLGGALTAWLIVAAAGWLIAEPLQALALAYQVEFAAPGLHGDWRTGLPLLLVGSALGLAGSWLALARHLAGIQPR